MRDFVDEAGTRWSAGVAAEPGMDYKGRFYWVLTDEDGGQVALVDVRWNSERSASRTLETMSVVELRRRLRSAVGRRTAPA